MRKTKATLPKTTRKTTHWTHAEDSLVQTLRGDGVTWREVAVQVSALGTPRSPATCLQRHLYLGRTRPKGWVSLRSLPGDGVEVLITFPGSPSMTVQTTRTLRDLLAFLSDTPPIIHTPSDSMIYLEGEDLHNP